MAQKFKIGDRVGTPSSGSGTVVFINEYAHVGVEHDSKHFHGHSCDRHCKTDNGWYYLPEHLKLLSVKQELHFVRDGNVVHAILKDGGKVTRAKATCSPDDEFNFLTGVELAKARVLGCETKIKKPEPVKVEKFKRYILKPYDEVKDHRGIPESTWKRIKWVMAVEVSTPNHTFHFVDNKNYKWNIPANAVLREAKADE